MINKIKIDGFMLIELMIALGVSVMVCATAYAMCEAYQRHYRNQQRMMVAQQNLTGAVAVMEQQIRMAGYDPEESGQFGITDVRRYDLMEASRVTLSGQPAIFYTYDRNGDGVLEGGTRARNGEHPSFRIQKSKNSGVIFLSYDNGSGRRPFAENIEAMGIAYAVDADQDGRLDSWRGGSHLIWAVDSDNDNLLDTHIDSDDDGEITPADDTNGDGSIDWADGARLNPQIELRHIKCVRIWLLAISTNPVKVLWKPRTYLVGDRVMTPSKDGRLWRLMETTIDCRNL